MKPLGICLAGLVFAGASLAHAQTPMLTLSSSGCPSRTSAIGQNFPPTDSAAARLDSARPAARSNAHPDVVLLVGFSAEELTFHSQPNASVRFCWGSDSLHIVERRNLPSPVTAGTTYRNVYVAAELRAFLNPECLGAGNGGAGSAPKAGCPALGITVSGPSPPTVSPPPK